MLWTMVLFLWTLSEPFYSDYMKDGLLSILHCFSEVLARIAYLLNQFLVFNDINDCQVRKHRPPPYSRFGTGTTWHYRHRLGEAFLPKQ